MIRMDGTTSAHFSTRCRGFSLNEGTDDSRLPLLYHPKESVPRDRRHHVQYKRRTQWLLAGDGGMAAGIAHV